MATREKIIDALAQLMAKQSGRNITYPNWTDDWWAVSDHYSKQEDRPGSYYREKAERFYERHQLIEMMSNEKE